MPCSLLACPRRRPGTQLKKSNTNIDLHLHLHPDLSMDAGMAEHTGGDKVAENCEREALTQDEREA